MKRAAALAIAVGLGLAAPALAQDGGADIAASAPQADMLAAAASPSAATIAPMLGFDPLAAFGRMVSFPTPPAPSRARPALTTEEGGLWQLSDRAEAVARASGQLEKDPALNTYLREVACRVADTYCGDVRLYVMNRPVFNAQMAPNGYMEVWSGLLLRAEDEAQLAFVLGHEIGHYHEQHSVEQLRTVRSRANTALILTGVIAAAGTAAAMNSPNSAGTISNTTQVLGDIVYLGTIASLFGFSRELESDADSVGFEYAVKAGYDKNAGHALWTNLIAETAASDIEDVRKSETRASIFRTHPLSADRVQALVDISSRESASGETQRLRYRAAIRPHLDSWLRAELRRRDFGQTLLILDRLGAHGEDLGVVEFYRGEVHRLRRRDGDLETARAHYEAAIAHADAPALAWRTLGEMHAREGRNAEAGAAFGAYLERAPEAPDRLMIEARLKRIAEGGGP